MNVISFSVWGNSSAYFFGLLDNIIMIKYQMPTFQCWVYHNNSLPLIIKNCILKLGNTKLISMNNTNDKRNSLWRFLPAFDPKVNICLVRDTDSRIEMKELKCIIEWLQSDKDFHIMRNHPMHRRKILAGMWGCRNQILLPLKKKYDEYIKKPYTHNNWIVDEIFLTKYIYPFVIHNSFVHASHNKYEKNAVTIPKEPRNKYGEFIGAPTANIIWIKKEFPTLKIPYRLIKKRIG